ncbi:hypothetical protein BX616_000597 [Lobosporangium transversale]|nr:hypothetical protein BX616_000597 [Lobosporangium transversale]
MYTLLLRVASLSPSKASSGLPSPSPSPSSPSTAVSLKRVVIKELKVSDDESGMRLDRFLKYRFGRNGDDGSIEVPHSLIYKWLRKRQIRLLEYQEGFNNVSIKTKAITSVKTRTETGQIWLIRAALNDFTPKSASEPADIDPSHSAVNKQTRQRPLDALPLRAWIVYMDERIIVLNKPAGIAVQGGTGVASSIDSSLSVLQYDFSEKPRLVHRLDKTTSGLLVLARTRRVAQDLAKRFHEGSARLEAASGQGTTWNIRKKYLAIIESRQPLTLSSLESMGAWRGTNGLMTMGGDMVLIEQGNNQTIHMRSSIDDQGDIKPRITATWPSKTDFRILDQRSCGVEQNLHWALLELYPQTGRKHQLRIHCAELMRAPILGDRKYTLTIGRTESKSPLRIYLHLEEITLKVDTASDE